MRHSAPMKLNARGCQYISPSLVLYRLRSTRSIHALATHYCDRSRPGHQTIPNSERKRRELLYLGFAMFHVPQLPTALRTQCRSVQHPERFRHHRWLLPPRCKHRVLHLQQSGTRLDYGQIYVNPDGIEPDPKDVGAAIKSSSKPQRPHWHQLDAQYLSLEWHAGLLSARSVDVSVRLRLNRLNRGSTQRLKEHP